MSSLNFHVFLGRAVFSSGAEGLLQEKSSRLPFHSAKRTSLPARLNNHPSIQQPKLVQSTNLNLIGLNNPRTSLLNPSFSINPQSAESKNPSYSTQLHRGPNTTVTLENRFSLKKVNFCINIGGGRGVQGGHNICVYMSIKTA